MKEALRLYRRASFYLFRNIGRAIPPKSLLTRWKSGSFLPLHSGTMALRRKKYFRSISVPKRWTFPHWGILCVLVYFFFLRFYVLRQLSVLLLSVLGSTTTAQGRWFQFIKSCLHQYRTPAGTKLFPTATKKETFPLYFCAKTVDFSTLGNTMCTCAFLFSCVSMSSGNSQHGSCLPLGAPQQKKSDTLTGTAL